MRSQYQPTGVLVYVNEDPNFFYNVSLFYLLLFLVDKKLAGISDSDEFW